MKTFSRSSLEYKWLTLLNDENKWRLDHAGKFDSRPFTTCDLIALHTKAAIAFIVACVMFCIVMIILMGLTACIAAALWYAYILTFITSWSSMFSTYELIPELPLVGLWLIAGVTALISAGFIKSFWKKPEIVDALYAKYRDKICIPIQVTD